ncbi:MAG: DUF3306 domain-containing protein [Wenzhouxiangellaceae bacterium]|nr:DUF3306 domain-containing protein [Wenzhouxiangellaceae bacterium]
MSDHDHDRDHDRDDDSERFLSRWARLKGRGGDSPEPGPEQRQVQPDPAVVDNAPDATDAAADPNVDPNVDPAADAPGDEDMPPLEDIDQGGKVDAFFSPRVSQALRKAALRRLFRQPTLPVGDDLDDYAEDFRKFTRLGDVVTHEMKYRLEKAKERLEAKARKAAAEAEPGSVRDPSGSTATAEPTPDTSERTENAAGAATDPAPEDQTEANPDSIRPATIEGPADNDHEQENGASKPHERSD